MFSEKISTKTIRKEAQDKNNNKINVKEALSALNNYKKYKWFKVLGAVVENHILSSNGKSGPIL